MKHIKKFESIINKYVTDQMIRHRIRTSVLMDVLSEIKDENDTSFNLQRDEYIDGPICYGSEFYPYIPISFLTDSTKSKNSFKYLIFSF